MRIAKQLLTEAVIGIMIGATVYLTTLMLHLDTINPTPRSIAGLFIMSAVIGILSSISILTGSVYQLHMAPISSAPFWSSLQRTT